MEVMFYSRVSDIFFALILNHNLFTIRLSGREFFVGISKWTNEAGAKAVAAAFPEYPCVPIKVCRLYCKSFKRQN